MKILITGDLVINQSYEEINNIDQNIVDLFHGSNINIVNLEAPITNNTKKILKTGPHLKSNTKSTLQALKYLNINLVTLANNHIKDYDQKGVIDTIEWCKSNNILSVGAGKNLKYASKPLILDTKEGKISIINIAENEWASADSHSAGANGMNLIKDIKQIQNAKQESDFVFVIVHGGHEYYSLPSPRMQEQYRFYIDQGADLVVGHHTHALSGYEIYNNSPIYYSLGNFLFTEDSTYDAWYKGLILEIIIEDGLLKHSVHPIKQTSTTFELDLCQEREKEYILNQILSYNSIINDEKILNDNWEQFAKVKYNTYMNYWSPTNFIKSKYFNGLKNKLKINLTNKRSLTLYSNLIRCESHYDLSKAIIKKRIEE